MCNAGFEILDVFPMSASYPEGTDDSSDKYDAVHYKRHVFKPAEQLLFEYAKQFSLGIRGKFSNFIKIQSEQEKLWSSKFVCPFW